MSKMNFLLNGIVLFGILGIAYLLTMYSDPIRSTVQTTKTAVAGVNTSTDLPNTFPQELQQDVAIQVEHIKKDTLAVSLGEVFSFFGRAGKIIDDFHALQNDMQEKIESKEK